LVFDLSGSPSLARSRYTAYGPFFGAVLFQPNSIAAAYSCSSIRLPAGRAHACSGVVFVLQGVFEISFAFECARIPVGRMLILGIASVVMAVLIAAGWPAISAIVLGILLGVNFPQYGLAYIFVSRALKPSA